MKTGDCEKTILQAQTHLSVAFSISFEPVAVTQGCHLETPSANYIKSQVLQLQSCSLWDHNMYQKDFIWESGTSAITFYFSPTFYQGKYISDWNK